MIGIYFAYNIQSIFPDIPVDLRLSDPPYSVRFILEAVKMLNITLLAFLLLYLEINV